MVEKFRILIVDDDDLSRVSLRKLFQPEDVEIDVARDGLEALRKIRKKQPDIVLLDLYMPRLNGLEVIKKLKGDDSTDKIPILIVTAMDDRKLRIEAIEAGADDFFPKPVDTLVLHARIRTLLKMKQRFDEMTEYQRLLEIAVKKRTGQLEAALRVSEMAALETVYRLMRAAEYKDEETGAHIQRMASYATAVASALDMPSDFVKHLLHAAPMHDLGKIGIPDHILLKPGKLSAEEWTVMQTHTEIGAKILAGSDSEFIQMAEIVALNHHERWDGKGYPRGIGGNDIPVAGRIVAISDVFDALTSSRPYRKEPMPVEKAFEIIAADRETHFDPGITDVFLHLRKEILHLRESFKESHLKLLVEQSNKYNTIPTGPPSEMPQP
jgi:putative two-component system response regulator